MIRLFFHNLICTVQGANHQVFYSLPYIALSRFYNGQRIALRVDGLGPGCPYSKTSALNRQESMATYCGCCVKQGLQTDHITASKLKIDCACNPSSPFTVWMQLCHPHKKSIHRTAILQLKCRISWLFILIFNYNRFDLKA